MKKQQLGISFWGLLYFLFTIIVIGFLLIKTLPVYFQYYQVSSSVEALAKKPVEDLASYPPSQAGVMLRKKLLNQLYINGVKTVSVRDIHITYKESYYLIRITYNVKQPFFYNMTLLFKFDSSAKVPLNGS